MKSPTRCAIYTRKSTEEGLEQEFNTLHAQREACEAYVLSQAGEGWTVLPKLYDDGGFSGGTLERPALQELLGDIDRGLVDVVVVYKIDRLTRALAGFAKLVECFDARNVSFVSVTQAFSTTTSMGRLTLNVLLSFAQFERELTAERIRDKFAASRAKGIFMGGNPPLGYDARDRKLVVNQAEAETVRHIFERYLELNSIAKLRRYLADRGIRSKSWVSTRGRQMGGGPWYVGSLNHFLRNRVYVGLVVHKGDVYPGQHDAILSRDLFDKVQARLETNRVAYKCKTTIGSKSLLTGLIFDGLGYAMSPKTSRRRGGKTYTYYVSQAAIQNAEPPEKIIRPAAAPLIEELVLDRLRFVMDALDIEPLPKTDGGKGRLDSQSLVRKYVARVEIREEQTRVLFHLSSLQESSNLGTQEILDRAGSAVEVDEAFKVDDANLVLTIDQPLPRKGGRKSLAGWDKEDWKTPRHRVDPNLVKALTRAHVWRDMIEAGEVKTISELAEKAGSDRSHLRSILHLAFLAPDTQQAILSGRQPAELRLRTLLKTHLPTSWVQQRRIIGPFHLAK